MFLSVSFKNSLGTIIFFTTLHKFSITNRKLFLNIFNNRSHRETFFRRYTSRSFFFVNEKTNMTDEISASFSDEESSNKLHLYNSLTRKRDLFRPLHGNQVKFYICGPTVYDSAHMGHGRAYLSFDILRRVMSKYFNYDILYVMNITDIDDKIIKRGRQNYLFDQYSDKLVSNNLKSFAEDLKDALSYFSKKLDTESDPDRKNQLSEEYEKVNSLAKSMNLSDLHFEKLREFVFLARSVLGEWLDCNYGHTVNNLDVFSKLAKRYEEEFLGDMKLLDVMPPNVLTRVSEYIPEIISYIEKIIANGYAYVSDDGSVYFDTNAYASNPNHKYAKLRPDAYCTPESADAFLRESEGELSCSNDTNKKRSPCDFALWKRSKIGEPFWNSPWGEGRPGWHIECSAMSSAICGDRLDIHAGGFDLKFPHHDNEIAQCEAYSDTDSWVNYFLHCGTLRICGLKMSKSLKNFITIKEALTQYSARQIRILFLMHNWTDVLDYSAETMEHVLKFEKLCNEFFLLVKDFVRKQKCDSTSEFFTKYESSELELLEQFSVLKHEIHLALCNSIDTHAVIEKIRSLISKANIYVMNKNKNSLQLNLGLLVTIAEYVTWLFKIFGVVPEQQQFGFPMEVGSLSELSNKEEVVMPYVNAIVAFRENVRDFARNTKDVNILKACDQLRDIVLPELGVRLEDKSGQTCVKLEDPAKLKKELEQKQQIVDAKQAKKTQQKAKQEKKIKP